MNFPILRRTRLPSCEELPINCGDFHLFFSMPLFFSIFFFRISIFGLKKEVVPKNKCRTVDFFRYMPYNRGHYIRKARETTM